MNDTNEREAITEKSLLHLYNSAVIGSVRSSAMIISMNTSAKSMASRYRDLLGVYDLVGPDKRELFYSAIASIAEFAVYRTLDFVEQYNSFDDENNVEKYPHLELAYVKGPRETIDPIWLSTFGTEDLGDTWKRIVRREDTEQLLRTAVQSVSEKGTG